jgi:2-amino-4-hydroxy-6-hydroxymethyldihydropteridine diphosphokinase
MKNEPVRAYISLGSNLGDSQAILEQAMVRLQDLSAAPILRSSLWRTTPVNCPPGSPDFVNAAAAITPLPGESPESLLGKLRLLESEAGRSAKRVVNEPRLLDLDLIAFGEERRDTTELTLPHRHAHVRRFVLEPLAEIAPELVLPGQTMTVRELLTSCAGSVRRA